MDTHKETFVKKFAEVVGETPYEFYANKRFKAFAEFLNSTEAGSNLKYLFRLAVDEAKGESSSPSEDDAAAGLASLFGD